MVARSVNFLSLSGLTGRAPLRVNNMALPNAGQVAGTRDRQIIDGLDFASRCNFQPTTEHTIMTENTHNVETLTMAELAERAEHIDSFSECKPLLYAVDDAEQGIVSDAEQVSEARASVLRGMAKTARDAGDLSLLLQSFANDRYSPDSCPKGSMRLAGWNSFRTQAQQVIGETERNGGDRFAVSFSTRSPNPKAKAPKERVVSVSLLSQAEIAAAERRAAEDEAMSAKRAEEDSELREQADEQRKAQLTDTDVARQVLDYLIGTYPHNPSDVVAAMSALLDSEQEQAA